MRCQCIAFALGLFVATSAHDAHAQKEETRLERAERLFTEGRAALQAGRHTEACLKLAESQSLDPGTGTLLALALCHEGEGRLGTAYKEFGEVAAQAESQGRSDRVTMARQHLRAIEPQLPRLVVTVSATPIPAGLEIRVDGRALAPSEWNRPMVTDPGPHRIEAAAPGKRPRNVEVSVAAGEQKTFAVAALDDEPAAAEAAAAPVAEPAAPPPPRRGERSLASGIVVGGAGLVALGVGAVFGLRAIADQSKAEERCQRSPCGDREGVSANESARTNAWIANIGVGVGLIGLGVGTYLLLRQPSPATRTVTFAPRVAPSSASLSMSGAF